MLTRSSHSTRRSGPGALPACLALLASLAAGCGSARPDLLLLISVDTLRADHLGAYGSDRELTPRLDALAAESLVFASAYAPASFTLPSVVALLSGRYPEELGIWNNHAILAEGVPTLATELARRGWSCQAVVSNFVLRREAGLAQGFDPFDDELPDLEAARRIPERKASATTDALLQRLDACPQSADGRCFLWGHYQDPHGPYTPPEELRRRYLPRERKAPGGRRVLPLVAGGRGLGGLPSYQLHDGHRQAAWYRAGYAGEIRHTDEEIGRLLDGLRQRGRLDRAVVAFVADHGESLGENDYWFSHGRLLTEPLVRVPLMLRIPGRAPGWREDVVSLVDLFPTLLRLLAGAEREPDAPGRDLLGAGAAEQASRVYLAALGGSPKPRYGLVVDRFKLVVSGEAEERRVQLFQRGSDAPDLSEGMPLRRRELEQQLERLRQRAAGRAPAELQSLSRDEREALGALGYGE